MTKMLGGEFRDGVVAKFCGGQIKNVIGGVANLLAAWWLMKV